MASKIRRSKGALRSPLAAAVIALAGCSSLDPKVGAPNQCVAVDGPMDDSRFYAGGDAGGYSPASSGGSAGAYAGCPVPAGSWCDDCESTNCCASRLRCYADPACAAADQMLDGCLADGGAEGGSPACFAAFLTQGGAIAQARMDCERSCCPGACAHP